jgi:hypothetical protein
MYCSNLTFKFYPQTQKKLVGFSHYGHFRKLHNSMQHVSIVFKRGREGEERETYLHTIRELTTTYVLYIFSYFLVL